MLAFYNLSWCHCDDAFSCFWTRQQLYAQCVQKHSGVFLIFINHKLNFSQYFDHETFIIIRWYVLKSSKQFVKMQIRNKKKCYYKKYFAPLWAPCRELPILPTEGRGMFIFYRDRNKGLSNAFLLCKYCVIYSLFFLVCTFRLKSTSCLILTGSNQLRKGTKSMFVWVTNYEKLGIWNHSSRDKEGFLLGRYVGWNLNDWQGGKEMVPHWLRVS